MLFPLSWNHGDPLEQKILRLEPFQVLNIAHKICYECVPAFVHEGRTDNAICPPCSQASSSNPKYLVNRPFQVIE
jgi:hypothetical protein